MEICPAKCKGERVQRKDKREKQSEVTQDMPLGNLFPSLDSRHTSGACLKRAFYKPFNMCVHAHGQRVTGKCVHVCLCVCMDVCVFVR